MNISLILVNKMTDTMFSIIGFVACLVLVYINRNDI